MFAGIAVAAAGFAGVASAQKYNELNSVAASANGLKHTGTAQERGNRIAKFIAPTSAPSGAAYVEYDGGGFTASWRAPGEVELTVFSIRQELARFGSDFKGVNAVDGRIDAEKPNLPEGWSVDVSGRGTEDVRDGALIFDAFGDRVRMPYMPGLMVGLEIDCEMVDVVGTLDFKNCGELTISYIALNGDVLARRSFYGLNFERRNTHDFFANMQFGSVDVAFVELEWTAPEGGTNITGKLKINRIDYAYLPHEVALKERVEGGSFRVEGLDASKDYFFYLGNENGFSETVRVEEFLPVAMLDADMVTPTSMRVRWEPNPKATSYGVKVWEYRTHPEDEVATLLADSFAASQAGSVAQPVSVTSFDGLTDVPGWTGNRCIAAQGMIGAEAGGNYRTFGYLLTPRLNLAAAEGVYAVALEGVGEPGTQLSVYHKDYIENYQLKEHLITVGADGRFSDTWSMADGDDHTQLQIVSKSLKRFLISRMEVGQTIAAGTVTEELVVETTVDNGIADSFAVEALKPATDYACEVTGHRLDLYGWEQTAKPDRRVRVTTPAKSDGVALPSASSLPALRLTPEGVVEVATPRPELLTICNAQGAEVWRQTLTPGFNAVAPALPKGVYVARAGGATLKFAVR